MKYRSLKYKKLLCICIVLLFCIILAICLYHLNNKTIYKIEREIRHEYHDVTKINIGNFGPNSYLSVYLSDDIGLDKVRPIFLKLMVMVAEKDNFEYIEKRHNKEATGEFYFFEICFLVNKKIIYKYKSVKDFKTWELDGNSTEKYELSDYKKDLIKYD